MTEDLWGPRPYGEGDTVDHVIGDLRLSITRVGDEWHIARHYESPSSPSEVQTGRWVLAGAGSQELQLTPVVPDCPVVVRPEVPMHLPPGSTLPFYLTVPAWVRVGVFRPKPIVLVEYPSVVLSRTWFGDSMSGELCYALTTRARRNLADVSPQPHQLTCAVQASNASGESLTFERFCARMPHLATYRGEHRLWTNGLKVAFKGLEAGSTVDYETRPPSVELIHGQLAEPREKQSRGQKLRSFTTFDGLGDFLGLHGGL